MSIIKKYPKLITIGLTLIVVLYLLPRIIFLCTFNPNNIHEHIVNAFNRHGYHVTINGNINHQFWHGLSFSINNIQINTNDNQILSHIQNATLELSTLDILLGKYHIKRATLNYIDINEHNIISNRTYDIFNQFKYNELDSLDQIELNNINTLDQNLAPYPIHSGHITINLKGITSQFNISMHVKKDMVFLSGSLVPIKPQLFTLHNLIIKSTPDAQGAFLNAPTKIMLTPNVATIDLRNQFININNLNGKIDYIDMHGQVNIPLISLNTKQLYIKHVTANIANNSNNIAINIDNIVSNNYQNIAIDHTWATYSILLKNYHLQGITNFTNILLNNQTINASCTSSNNLNHLTQHNSINLDGVCQYGLQQLNLNLHGALNDSPLTLNLMVNSSSNKPDVYLNGLLESIDLTKFSENESSQNLSLYNNNNPIPLNWLDQFNMHSQLSINHLKIKSVNMDNVFTSFTLQNGTLNIKKLYSSIYSGYLVGNFLVKKTKTGYYDIKLNEQMDRLNLKSLLGDIFGVTAISGTGNVKISANSNHIITVNDIYKNLTGIVTIDAHDGEFSGVNFNLFRAAANGALTFEPSQTTPFKTLNMRLNFAQGISHNSLLNFVSPFALVSGGGILDLVHAYINYALTIKSTLPNNKQKIKSIIVPVSVTGNLFSPQINIKNIHLLHNDIMATSGHGIIAGSKVHRFWARHWLHNKLRKHHHI